MTPGKEKSACVEQDSRKLSACVKQDSRKEKSSTCVEQDLGTCVEQDSSVKQTRKNSRLVAPSDWEMLGESLARAHDTYCVG